MEKKRCAVYAYTAVTKEWLLVQGGLSAKEAVSLRNRLLVHGLHGIVTFPEGQEAPTTLPKGSRIILDPSSTTPDGTTMRDAIRKQRGTEKFVKFGERYGMRAVPLGQYLQQQNAAEVSMAELEKRLLAEGYTRVGHDEWKAPEK